MVIYQFQKHPSLVNTASSHEVVMVSRWKLTNISGKEVNHYDSKSN